MTQTKKPAISAETRLVSDLIRSGCDVRSTSSGYELTRNGATVVVRTLELTADDMAALKLIRRTGSDRRGPERRLAPYTMHVDGIDSRVEVGKVTFTLLPMASEARG